MSRELVIGIPGPWTSKAELVGDIAGKTRGEYLFAGLVLMDTARQDHVEAFIAEADPNMRLAFEIAGQGHIAPDLLETIADHNSVVYLHFPLDAPEQKFRLLHYTNAIRRAGGFAVKIESAGIAHSWDVWEYVLQSENLFDLYRGFVTLIGSNDYFYSCGMHHFSLSDIQVPRNLDIEEAADLMNRFNYYRLVERPEMTSGHTFSISTEAPIYLLDLIGDTRHNPDDLFHNPYGIWDLKLQTQNISQIKQSLRSY